ncbi:MAG TPA: translocation/assembly module TamB domain-containing protein [Gallionellaceae bacterium]|nr:translocation/assembly module TamB domain-containing protein [Gallionellaceae bacterium]
MSPHLLKNPGRYTVRFLLGVTVVAGVLVWLAGTEAALQWGARQAEGLSNGRLSLHAVHGSLYGPLRIESLSFQSGGMRVEAKELMLDWSPRSLLNLHIRITRLNLQELKIMQTKPSVEPARLPDTLHFPLSFSAPDIGIDKVIFRIAGTAQVLENIRLSAGKVVADYRLTLHRIDSAWGKADATVVLGDTQPYTVSAHATLQQEGDLAYRAEADVSGTLAQLLLRANARAQEGHAEINATLTPFGKIFFTAARITAGGINPARLRKGLPQANFGADISLFHVGEKDIEGHVMLKNGIPGNWDYSRIPLRTLSMQLSGAQDNLDLRTIRLDLGKAGDFDGDGNLANNRLQLQLNTRNFDPQSVHSKLRRMRLAGKIGLQAEAGRQQLSADLREQNFRLQLDAQHQHAVLELRSAKVESAAGSLALHGALALDDLRKFQLSGALQKFNPADFGHYPAGSINASFSASGQLARSPQATLDFAVTDSRLRQQPLSARGKLNLSAIRIWNSDITLQLAQNRAELKGGLGSPDDTLAFSIDAGNLDAFDPGLGGRVRTQATLHGKFSALSGQFDTQINDLSWGKDYRIAMLQASARLDKGENGALALAASLQGLATPLVQLDRASLDAQGTRIRHTLKFMAENPDFDLESQLAGGWHDESGWVGQVMDLHNLGRHAFALRSPAKLEIGRRKFLLNNADLHVEDADVVLHELAYRDGQVSSSGTFKGLPLAYVQHISARTADLKTDLRLNGEWQFAVRDRIDGHIAVWRQGGDVFLPSSPQTAWGLNRLSLNINAANNRLHGNLEATGDLLGSLKVDALGIFSRRDGVWGIAGDAPIRANANLSVDSIAWIAPLLNRTGSLALDGALKAEVHADGTLAQPQLAGSIRGERFSVAWQNQGLRFTDGRFHVELRDHELLLNQLSIRGGDGNLSGQGRLALEGEAAVMQLSLTADKLEVLSRPDRHLILSGSGNASAAGKKLQIGATLKADSGLIELPKDSEVTASDDVIVVGQPPGSQKKDLPYALSLDLDLDLGEQFFVKGKGLDAQLGGTLKLSSNGTALPSSRGNIHVIKGIYTAYGQRLEVERGILNFQGPLNNPGLNIIAMRKNQPVEAGVSVTGTAQSPRVKLVSNPSVPDSEKLSWLVLGYGLEDSSGKDLNALNAAAGVLLATGESITLQQKIAHAYGLEEVSLRGSGQLQGSVLSLGKRLSTRAYLNYEQGLTNASSLVKINYILNKRLSVQAQAGTTPAVDLFYTFRFD